MASLFWLLCHPSRSSTVEPCMHYTTECLSGQRIDRNTSVLESRCVTASGRADCGSAIEYNRTWMACAAGLSRMIEDRSWRDAVDLLSLDQTNRPKKQETPAGSPASRHGLCRRKTFPYLTRCADRTPQSSQQRRSAALLSIRDRSEETSLLQPPVLTGGSFPSDVLNRGNSFGDASGADSTLPCRPLSL